MKICIECNHKFTLTDRLKSAIRLKSYLKCPKCNSVYKPEKTLCRRIYYVLVLFISLIISNSIELNNSLLRYILLIFILTPGLMLYDFIPHRWQKYRKSDS